MTLDPLSMVCPPGTACPLSNIAGIGLPEILLWVLSFAVVYAIVSKTVLGKKAGALVSIATAFFVLMAVPAALITAIATMSTGLLVVAVGFLVLIALIEITNTRIIKKVTVKDKDGEHEEFQPVHPLHSHGALMTVILIAIAAVIFWFAGGAALIGLGNLELVGTIPWVLIIVGIAVLWIVM